MPGVSVRVFVGIAIQAYDGRGPRFRAVQHDASSIMSLLQGNVCRKMSFMWLHALLAYPPVSKLYTDTSSVKFYIKKPIYSTLQIKAMNYWLNFCSKINVQMNFSKVSLHSKCQKKRICWDREGTSKLNYIELTTPSIVVDEPSMKAVKTFKVPEMVF